MRNPLSLEAFADWCDKQPADAAYNYGDNNGCAFCQYLNHVGIENTGVGGKEWWDGGLKIHELPDGVWQPLVRSPCTFGALASRLRA